MNITYRPMSEGEPREIDKIFAEAAKDRYLGDIVYDRKTDKTILFNDGAKTIGFAIPRLEAGFWRVGPIYVTPHYQGKGVALGFVKDFFKDKKGRAYIEPTNSPSRKLFKAVGFKETGKTLTNKAGEVFLQYEWNPPTNTLSW